MAEAGGAAVYVKEDPEEVQDILHVYSQGHKFPQHHELAGFIKLLEVVKEHYSFVHPLDCCSVLC